ncbi:YdcF family protein [Falsiroseomonas selenitidurans]|uniref:YdcF family protein n=1 Tax=Falsiroseomonas selenitidurans TaxID=2716335 RepID=A0ABX1E4M7_9PROT|nr:YdcF family protein [Falsiroseomonas selenitidurans]NKC32144.1 YdcF family protein [Falsiroseomonas selenitidurans]
MTDAFFLVSKLAWGVLRPNTLALLLAVAGLVLVWRGRRFGRWPLALGLGWYGAVFALPVAALLTLPLENRFPRPTQAPAQVTGIIVLGGAVEQRLTEARGIPALNGAAERMTEGVALALRHPEAKLVFTGGTAAIDQSGPTEAATAAMLFASLGLPEGRLVLEDASRNTHENAVFTHRLLAPKPGETWLLVTSASHMPRSMGVFRAAGWRITAWPVNYTTGADPALWWDNPFPSRLNQAEWALREWVGLTVYWLTGRTGAWFPAP